MSSPTLSTPASPSGAKSLKPAELALIAGLAATFFYFYGFLRFYGNFREQSVLEWIWAVCGKAENDYYHGRFIPLVMGVLIWHARRKIAAAPRSTDHWGLGILILGVLFYLIAARTVQARVAAGSIPFIVYGVIAYVWGRQVARHFIVPLVLVFFAIPLPGLHQATNGLQLIATKVAYYGSTALGCDIHIQGNEIFSSTGKWDGFNIAEGCSGIRSLFALMLIALVYGSLTQNTFWKKAALLAVSVPIAIAANSIRVATIVIIAEYVNADFAESTYHNWSGFVFFLCVGLGGLMLAGRILDKGLGALKPAGSRVVTVRAGEGAADTLASTDRSPP
ncbi:MAG TPA: exosortase/archaeosortase family protein [Burkholderiales bacterium]|nr:exosortase/archaeosortase family protein [Burkholderiales bacterium]